MTEKLDGHFDEIEAPVASNCSDVTSSRLYADCYNSVPESLPPEQQMNNQAALFARGLEQRLDNGFGQIDLANCVKGLAAEDAYRMATLMNRALREEGLADKLYVTGSSDGEISLTRRNVQTKSIETAHENFYEPGEGPSFNQAFLDKETVKAPLHNFARSLKSSHDEIDDGIALKQLVSAFKEQGADPMDIPSIGNTVLRANNIPFYLQANSDGEVKLFRKESTISNEKLATVKIQSTD
jgi:hypothetical protein